MTSQLDTPSKPGLSAAGELLAAAIDNGHLNRETIAAARQLGKIESDARKRAQARHDSPERQAVRRQIELQAAASRLNKVR